MLNVANLGQMLTGNRAQSERLGHTIVPPLKSRRLPVQRQWHSSRILAAQVGIFILIIAYWEIGVRVELIDGFFWSKPSDVWSTLLIFVGQGEAFLDTWFTFRSTLLGFVFGTAIGAIIGLSFWWSRNYAHIIQPYLVCFEAMPKLALAPLVILVFGMGLASKVALGVALTLVVTVLTCYAGVKAVDPDQEKLMYALGASRRQVFTKLVMPSVLPWIISILRVNIGLALTGSIVGEFISSQYGLGRRILYAGEVYDIALIWVGVLVLSVLSVVMYIGVGWLERWLIKGVAHQGTAKAGGVR